MFNNFQQHFMPVYEEKLQSVLPVSSTPGTCDAGNHGNMTMEHSFDNSKYVEKQKDEGDGNDTSQKEKEKKSRQHVCDICFKTFTLAGSLKTHMLTHTGTKPFVCGLCGKAFTLNCNLKSHELIHTGQKPFVCDVCNKAFTQASHLKAHKRIHTGERPYKCPYCEADFNQSNHVQKHIRTVHASNSRYISDVAFPTFIDLERHKSQRIDSGGKPYVDTNSGERSIGSSQPENQSYRGAPAVRSDLIQPRPGEASHQVTSYCEDDGEMDEDGDRESYGDLQPGANRHSGHPLSGSVSSPPTTNQSTKEWTCEGVGKAGQNPERTREELLHSFMKRKPANYISPPVPKDDEIIYCEDCDQESQGDCPVHSPVKIQRNHVSSATADSPIQLSPNDGTSPHKSLLFQDRSHMCHRCSGTFVMFNSLKLHMLFVHGEKVQAVVPVSSTPDSCDRDNPDSMDMEHDNFDDNHHDTVGMEDDSFDDDDNHDRLNIECDSFDDRESVKKRKGGNDTGEKREKKKTNRQMCDICFKSFTYLKMHKLTHTGVKQFECSMCSKSFSLACNLKSHELTHTGQRPFVCNICSKAFTQASHLKAHKRIHTGERPYKCPHCDADFNQSNHVQKHIRTVHAGDKQNFVCEICGGTFSRSAELKKHKKVHSGEKADREKRSARSRRPKKQRLVHPEEDSDHTVPFSPDEDS